MRERTVAGRNRCLTGAAADDRGVGQGQKQATTFFCSGCYVSVRGSAFALVDG